METCTPRKSNLYGMFRYHRMGNIVQWWFICIQSLLSLSILLYVWSVSFEKDVSKLMKNWVYGRTMGNCCKLMLVSEEDRIRRLDTYKQAGDLKAKYGNKCQLFHTDIDNRYMPEDQSPFNTSHFHSMTNKKVIRKMKNGWCPIPASPVWWLVSLLTELDL